MKHLEYIEDNYDEMEVGEAAAIVMLLLDELRTFEVQAVVDWLEENDYIMPSE